MRDIAWYNQLQRIEAKLDQVLALMQVLLSQGDKMAGELQALISQVTANTTVEASAITLIQGLAAQIAALAAGGGTPAQFTAMATQLQTSAAALSAAITANTPPAPPPGP